MNSLASAYHPTQACNLPEVVEVLQIDRLLRHIGFYVLFVRKIQILFAFEKPILASRAQ
jgi:hypothetical protein